MQRGLEKKASRAPSCIESNDDWRASERRGGNACGVGNAVLMPSRVAFWSDAPSRRHWSGSGDWREAVARSGGAKRQAAGGEHGRGQWRMLFFKGRLSMHPRGPLRGTRRRGWACVWRRLDAAAFGRGQCGLGVAAAWCLREWGGTWTRENTCPSPLLCLMRTRCFALSTR